MLTSIVEPNNLRTVFAGLSVARDLVRGLREDGAFVWRVRQALLRLPFERETTLPAEVLPDAQPFHAASLQGKKVAVVASGGSGATASLVGVQRAFEEAGVAPATISACSGAVLFASLWACGLDAATVARFWLTLPRNGYLDPDWRKLLRAGGAAFRGWGGLLSGDALEHSFRAVLGDRRLGETRIPFSAVVWNIDLNRVEYIGTRFTPELPVAVAARVGISIPIFVEPVQIGSHLYGDGGVVDIFPVRPVLEEQPDVIVGLNCYLPEGFAGEDLSGWRDRTFAILRASEQLRWSGMLALAREQARLAGDRLLLLHPVPYAEVRGAQFYETFLDRSRWPSFMLAGRTAARDALLRRGPPEVTRIDARSAGSNRPHRAGR
jgi:NTE family protein